MENERLEAHPNIETSTMTVAEFTVIRDNPVQRDTKKHSRKALKRHLKKLADPHALVSIATMPDGTRYKLDGHTRCYLWETEELEQPPILLVTNFKATDYAHLIELYRMFDNSDAAESSSDKMFSVIKHAFGYAPKSELLNKPGVKAALELICYANHSMDYTMMFELNKTHPEVVDALKLIDEKYYTKDKLNTAFLAAIIATVIKDGVSAFRFWDKYLSNAGIKSEGEADAVEIVNTYFQDIKKYAGAINRTRPADVKAGRGRDVHRLYLPRLISYYEGWKSNKTYSCIVSKQGWTIRRAIKDTPVRKYLPSITTRYHVNPKTEVNNKLKAKAKAKAKLKK